MAPDWRWRLERKTTVLLLRRWSFLECWILMYDHCQPIDDAFLILCASYFPFFVCIYDFCFLIYGLYIIFLDASPLGKLLTFSVTFYWENYFLFLCLFWSCPYSYMCKTRKQRLRIKEVWYRKVFNQNRQKIHTQARPHPYLCLNIRWQCEHNQINMCSEPSLCVPLWELIWLLSVT